MTISTAVLTGSFAGAKHYCYRKLEAVNFPFFIVCVFLCVCLCVFVVVVGLFALFESLNPKTLIYNNDTW